MLGVAKSLPDDPEELRAFTAMLLAEVKAQAMLIEKLRHQLAGHRAYRYGSSSESLEQLHLALEASELRVPMSWVSVGFVDADRATRPNRGGRNARG